MGGGIEGRELREWREETKGEEDKAGGRGDSMASNQK